jgi:hypothetical protein
MRWMETFLCAGLVAAFPIAARADSAPPALVGFAFSPASIDTTSTPAEVTVTARLTDDISGVASMRVVFSHQDVLSEPHDCESSVPVSGTALDGLFSCTVVFPQFSETGTWKVFVVDLLDLAGNRDLRTTMELAASGFPTDLQVVTQPDATPPALAGFNFLPRAIDTSTAAGRITVSFHVTDDRSGIAWAKVTFVGPGATGTIRGCTSLAVLPGQDPALDLVLACDVDFPQFSAEGMWRVFGVDIEDVAGNSRQYATSGLFALGFPTDLNITSTPDTTAPQLIDFSFSPAAIDTEIGGASVEVTFVAGDDLSGVASVDAAFAAPGAAAQTLDCVSGFPDSGSSLTGTFTCPIPFPQYSIEGAWTVSQVNLRDAVGNSTHLATPDLVLEGFPVHVAVGFRSGGPRATVSSPAAGRSIRGNSVTVAARLLEGDPASISRTAGVRLEYRALPSGVFMPIPARDPAQPNPDTTYPYFIHWDVTGLPQGAYEVRAVAHDGAGAPDPAPGVIAITFAGAAGGDVDEHVDPQGRQENRTLVDGAAGGRAETGGRTSRDTLVEVTLPQGAVSLPSDVLRTMFPDEAAETARLEQPGQSAGAFVDVSLESGQGVMDQGLAAGVDVHYADADQDGVVDQTAIREEDLELRRLDVPGDTYVALFSWIVLTGHNLVHGVATELGRFALTGPLEPHVRFDPDAVTLRWDPISAALSYNVYRGLLNQLRDTNGDGLPDGGYGTCQTDRDPNPADTAFIDTDAPAGPAGGFFYLVTYVDPEGEKGLGTTSRGLRRVVTLSCP